MVKKKRRVIEIIDFKINDGVTEEKVKKESDKVQAFLQEQPGYEHRLITNDAKTGKWQEQTQWRNLDYAQEARKKSKQSEDCKDYYNIIRPRTIKISYPELVKMY
ncbi:MAG: hypothetical protein PF542_01075 [Nanoarchaeota archaeon]|jgi:hypothetical protein|nr:hypothetical protein [Nanoarchaeota archaeon]